MSLLKKITCGLFLSCLIFLYPLTAWAILDDPLKPLNVFDMAQPNIMYVSLTGDDANDGSSFAFAKRTVKAAVDYANANATAAIPISIKIGVGVFAEDNPMVITNNYVSLKGESNINTIIEPTNDGQPVFDISATLPAEAANLEDFKIRGDTDFKNTVGSTGIKVTGDGFFIFQNIIIDSTDVGLSFGHGTINYPTVSIVVLNNMGPRSSNTCIKAVNNAIGLINSTAMAYCGEGISLNDSAYVQMNNWRSRGGPFGNTGIGLVVNDSATAISVGGTMIDHITGAIVGNGFFEGESNIFLNNTTDFDQTGTGTVSLNGGTLDISKVNFMTPVNAKLNTTDAGDNYVSTIGGGVDLDQKLIKINTGEGAASPELEYMANFAGHRGLVYMDYNTTKPVVLGVESMDNESELLGSVNIFRERQVKTQKQRKMSTYVPVYRI